jgi:predicted amidohydrolase YtcJ
MVLEIHKKGLQAAIHAIEENAVESACDAIEFALKRIPRPDHRHRIEHCSVCSPSLAKRIASLGIMIVTQPAFVFYNGDRYLKTVPQGQLQNIYPIGSLTKNKVVVAGSSDSPIAPASPLIGIYSAVARLSDRGDTVLPEERISLLNALRLYTDSAAKASFEDDRKGSISQGKLADLVLVSGDMTEMSPDEIKDSVVEMTIIGGNVVWSRSDHAMIPLST